MVFSSTKSLCRSVGWYIKAPCYFVFVFGGVLYYTLSTGWQKLKEFLFVPSANTPDALNDALPLVKRPLSIKRLAVSCFPKLRSRSARATKALFRFYIRALCAHLSTWFNTAVPKICNAKLAINSARRQTNRIVHGEKNACICEEFVHFRQKRRKNLVGFSSVVSRFFFARVSQLATRNDV